MAESDSWDAYAEGWDQDEAARAYAEAAFGSLVTVLAEADASIDGANVLDFGCGTGLLTERLVAAGASVHAVDTSAAMLAVLHDKMTDNGWTQVTTSADLTTVPGGRDLIVCSSVCAFLDDYPAAVADLVDLLAPGGLFVQWDWERAGDDEHGLSRPEILAALDRAGLDRVVVDTAFTASVGDATMAPLIGHGRRP